MRQQAIPDLSLQNILRVETTRTFLGRLALMGKVHLTVSDDRCQPLTLCSADGVTHRIAGAAPEQSVPDPGSPALRTTGAGSDPLTHEIRFRDRLLGFVHGCLYNGSDPKGAALAVRLATDWLRERIESDYNQNSLAAEILNNYEELNLLYELSEEVASVFEVHTICRIVLTKALSVIGAERASIFLWSESDGKLHLMAAAGFPGEIPGDLALDPAEGICGHVFRTGKPLLVEEIANLPKEINPGISGYRTESFLSAPLLASPMRVKGKVIGVINLADRPAGRGYQAADLKLLSAISSQATLSVLNSTLIEGLKENERLHKEMEIAETLQKNLLPRKAPKVPGVDLAGCCAPAREVGGDYYDFFLRPKGNLGMVVADVSGHSVSSGIMMAITRGLLQSEAVHAKSPARLLTDVNLALFPDLVSSELFITMAYCSYDPDRHRISFASGGHHPPILLRSGCPAAELLDAEGMAIGLLPSVAFEEKHLSLARGDILLLYTDGLMEAEDPRGVQFGLGRVLEHLQQSRTLGAEQILQGLYRAVTDHMGSNDLHVPPRDDITIVVLKVLENS